MHLLGKVGSVVVPQIFRGLQVDVLILINLQDMLRFHAVLDSNIDVSRAKPSIKVFVNGFLTKV